MRFHLRTGMLVADANGGFDAFGEDGLGFVESIALCKHLGIHLIGGDVIGGILQKSAKVGVGRVELTLAKAVQRDAVTRKRIVRILSEKFFQFLATEITLFSHSCLSYYTCRTWVAGNLC